jgi:hypothetical protein
MKFLPPAKVIPFSASDGEKVAKPDEVNHANFFNAKARRRKEYQPRMHTDGHGFKWQAGLRLR